MIGAILGDIIGSKTEFHPIKTKDFELFQDGCKYTDDTVLTIATADAILNAKPFQRAYQEWGNKYYSAGFGGMFRRWLKNPNPLPYNSFGNGSAMRVSPVGWAYDTLEQTLEVAKVSAEVSHNHIEGIKGAQAVAGAIFLARQNESKDAIKHWVENTFTYNLSRSVTQIRKNYKFDETCRGSVPEAITCFLEADSFEDTIRNAISLGGDADTQGAIAGSIAEAFYGIPDDMLPQINKYLPKDMTRIINYFYDLYVN